MLCIVLLNCVALGFETPMNNPHEVKARVLQTRCEGGGLKLLSLERKKSVYEDL